MKDIERKLISHNWVVDSIKHKNNIVFSHNNGDFFWQNIIIFNTDKVVRLPTPVNSDYFQNYGNWEVLKNDDRFFIRIKNSKYEYFNGLYSFDIKNDNRLIYLELKSQDFEFYCLDGF